MLTHSGRYVFRPVLVALILFLPASAGCLEVERPCPDNTCFPLTSSAFNSILESTGAMDALGLASEFEQLSVSTTSRFSESGITSEIKWTVEKDDQKKLRLVRNTVVVGGVELVGYEIWDGGPKTFSRTTGHWMEGRDMDPSYVDPFIELARLATERPEGRWPPFRLDLTQFSELSWTITGDATESYQIARATNGTHEIYFEIHGLPPRIVGASIYSGGLDQEDLTFSISIANNYWNEGLNSDYYLSMLANGEYLVASGLSDFPRSPVPFIAIPDHQSINGDTTSVIGSVSSGMTHEATLSEIEMHIFSEDSSIASIFLNEGDSNLTSEDGTWWDLTWIDAGKPGLLSEMDTYMIKTNFKGIFEIRIYDHWAQSWTDNST